MQTTANWRPDRPSIVGRVREQDRLHERLVATMAGRGGIVLLGGEAGIGKTTLVEDIGREAIEFGFRVLSGYCYDLTMTPPYGPWRDVLRTVASPNTSPLLTMLAATGYECGDALGKEEFFEQIHDELRSMTAEQPLLVVLEDLHWSDPASLDLLRFLARRLRDIPLLFVVTYRDTELTRHHPLFHTLPLLIREAGGERISVRRLTADEIGALVAGRYPLSSSDEIRLVEHLQDQADGNPLFIGEILRTLEEEGFLTMAPGGWVLGALDQVPVPQLVVHVIEGRLERLSDDDRTLMQIAAVIGHVAQVDLWQSVARVTEKQLLALIERGIDAYLLESTGDNATVRFVHALVRKAVHDGIVPVQRRLWHRQIAEHLINLSSYDPDVIARHFQQAVDPRAADWLIRAGDRAQRAYAMQSAAERFEEALRLLEPDDTRGNERGWLLYRVGRLLRYVDLERGIGFMDRAGEVADAVGDPVLAAYVQADRGAMRCMAFQTGRGLAELESGINALDAVSQSHTERMGDPIAAWVADSLPAEGMRRSDAQPSRASVSVISRRGTLVLWLAWAGRNAEALAIGEPYVALTESMTTVRDGYADAMHGLAIAYAATGRPDRAREAFERARAAYGSINHRVMVAVSTVDEWLEVALPYRTDRVEERRRMIEDARSYWRQASGSATNNDWPYIRTLGSGLLDGTWHEVRESALAIREQGEVFTYSLVGPALGRLARDQGEPELAWKIVHEHLPGGPASEPGAGLFLSDIAQQRLAIDLALDADDLPLASAWLAAHDRWLEWSGDVRGRADVELLRARYHRVAGDSASALQHATLALDYASQPPQPLVLLAAHRYLGQLATEARDYASAEQSLRFALDIADACAAPFERALTLVAIAELRQTTGKIDEASSLLEQVRSICVPLGAAPTLARIDAVETMRATVSVTAPNPAGLTSREMEVLRLVAQGLTDADVAERLFMARRTVNTHLTSIYTKIGVSSRAAATRFAVENGIT